MILYYYDFRFNKMFKNLVFLICVLMLLTACKQTQLTSNYNRRSNKIYTKAPLNFKNFDVVTNEKSALVPTKSIPIIKSTENQFYSIEKKDKDQLFTDVNVKEIKEFSTDHYIHERSVRADSILKSLNNPSTEKEARVDPISIISLLNGLTSFSFFLFESLTPLLSINTAHYFASFIFGIFSLAFGIAGVLNKISSPKKNKGVIMSIIGIILGVLSGLISGFVLLLFSI